MAKDCFYTFINEEINTCMVCPFAKYTDDFNEVVFCGHPQMDPYIASKGVDGYVANEHIMRGCPLNMVSKVQDTSPADIFIDILLDANTHGLVSKEDLHKIVEKLITCL